MTEREAMDEMQDIEIGITTSGRIVFAAYKDDVRVTQRLTVNKAKRVRDMLARAIVDAEKQNGRFPAAVDKTK